MPEILKKLDIPDKRSLVTFESAQKMFEFVQNHVDTTRQIEFYTTWGHIHEASFVPVKIHPFLREFLWCVYVAGFSAQTIANKYAALLEAHEIEGPAAFPAHETSYRGLINKASYPKIYSVFKNKRKAHAIQDVRKMLLNDGWDFFNSSYIGERDPKLLERLPGMGPALSCHLARNIGNINICKPDVHLKRLAAHYGFDSVEALCKGLSDDPVGKTDLKLWMASVDHGTT